MDLDAEFARFTAELKSVEAETDTQQQEQQQQEPLARPPLAPPPTRPPPSDGTGPGSSSSQPAAMAPPPAVLPPGQQQQQQAVVSPPPPVRPPPAAAAAQRQQQHQLAAPPQPAAHSSGPSWGVPLVPGGAPLAPGAPADPDTLRRLKEELLQQKQAAGAGRLGATGHYSAAHAAAAAAAGGGAAARGGWTGHHAGSAAAAAAAAAGTSNKRVVVREAAGTRWVDPTLAEWPENDFRIFVGDIGNEVNDDALGKAFSRYPSFAKAKVIRDKKTKKSKGFGIISLLDGGDFAKALKEMNGKYIGNRPCKLSKSTWQERALPTKGGGGKRPAGGAPGGGGGGPNKQPRTGPGPKAKYHIPIMRQK